MKRYFVYILASMYHGTIYIGSTSRLIERIWEHKNKINPGFTSKYEVTRLVYFEECPCAASMVQKERALKRWKRAQKIQLIEKSNPHWEDLYSFVR
jgi:putative endonuclease